MYESFYHLREKPFSLLPDPSFLYPSRNHRMALTMLEYGLMNPTAGFTVITGEIGAGKTTLIRQLLNQLDDELAVGLITNTNAAFGDLMQWVAMAFGLEYKGREKVELYESFMQHVIDEYARGRRTVLIIDEAQNLTSATLEELRMLSNVNADKDQVLQLVIAGQPQLRATLEREDLRQFVQRISVSYHLEALNAEETREYIRHRLNVAGGDPDLFDDEASNLIWYHSRGVPRLINTLCDTVLVYGFADQRELIDADLVREVARDRKAGGLFAGRSDDPSDDRLRSKLDRQSS